jgi:hypothetical protein
LSFELKFSPVAQKQFEDLHSSKELEKRFKAVRKALRLLADNPAHPSLKTHKYDSLSGPDGSEVFEAYAENNTPAAYRVFWSYHPPKTGTITVLLITPHPWTSEANWQFCSVSTAQLDLSSS